MDLKKMSLHRSKRSLSVVIPVLNEADSISLLLPRVQQILSQCEIDWEIVIVDDGSADHLETVIADFEQQDKQRNVQLIRLSRNFGKEAALTAGLHAARGDAVICMDGDGQHPPRLIPKMLQQWRQGYDMVIGAQQSRDSESKWLILAKEKFYSFLQNGERFNIPANAGDFRLMDRRVVDALLQLPERTRFMKGLYAWLGFKTVIEPFDADMRTAGTTKFRLRQLMELASLGITSFSMKPLRMVSGAGVLISILAFGYGLYITAETIVIGNPLSGWATLAAGMMLLSGIQLVCLGVIAEYLGRIFEEAKQRPLYIIDTTMDHSLVGQAASTQSMQL